MKKSIYFTLTGTKHYYGKDFLNVGDKVRLVKEPDNSYDHEAIRVEQKVLGKIGYVANSAHTVLGKTMSAGRLGEHIGKKSKAKVVCVLPFGVICKISPKHQK